MKRIQIIEDDFALKENTAEILELHGYRVTPFVNDKSDVEIFKNDKPDLIICDLQKSQASVKNFIEHLKEDMDFAKVPLVFFTEEGSLPDWFRHKLNNYFGCLKKPFREEELLEAVSLCLQADGNHPSP